MFVRGVRFDEEQILLGIVVPNRDINAFIKNPVMAMTIRKDKGLKSIATADNIVDVLFPDSVSTVEAQEMHVEKKVVVCQPSVKSIEDMPENLMSYIKAKRLIIVRVRTLKSYKEFTSVEILRRLLPGDVQPPTSFETVGHIAHLNLRKSHLPYKHLIGQVILDRNNSLKTVVNKIKSLDSEFRTCPLEVIAGEPKLETVLTENSFKFFIDFANVFWNSRLAREREKVAEMLPQGAIVCDVMAGVGGFGIYALKIKQCEVYSNDLNPAAKACQKKRIWFLTRWRTEWKFSAWMAAHLLSK
eukprot:Gregarina_sp_Poly_1__9984@NODE_662_length_6895_cov_76_689514_g492_i1_p3_GENE_NODE_662_length_6895_cov_76_689514_g492_i1NODE_662_length_6895_cov_76_689514_g492_i1_p3_ORF_typecomplete_len300_score40_68Met_10/PF02475_16/2_6e50Cons_hypoth95/PF03602_15/1_2e03Cons_hypoth95/PF03602_15/0_0069MetW/PF07021_12/4_9e03MetW/PF07021_12/0_0061PrmA/PF06325_13/5_8e03PrmA/PF06325_13/0_033MethyltransfD12/PF02086_15/0_034Methyltransf_18/PF12847_7/6_7e03Methyltransf_18/PF12847_7/0_1Methyltrans_SAM/PF10672_9/0_093Coro